MAVFSQMRAGSPDYLIAPSAPNPKKHATLFSGDNGRRPAPGAQCLPFAAASPPPKPAASAVVALGSLLRHPSTSKPQLSPAVLPRYPAVTDSRSPSSSTVGVGRPPTIGRRRPGGCAFRRPSPQRMPRLSPAASTHRRSRRQPRPSPAAIFHLPRPSPPAAHPPWPPPSTAAVAVCHGRPPRPPPSTAGAAADGRLAPSRPSPSAAAVPPPPSAAAGCRLPRSAVRGGRLPRRLHPHAAAAAPRRTSATPVSTRRGRRPRSHICHGRRRGRLPPPAAAHLSRGPPPPRRPPPHICRGGRLHPSATAVRHSCPPRPPPSAAGAVRRTSGMAVSILPHISRGRRLHPSATTASIHRGSCPPHIQHGRLHPPWPGARCQ